MGVRRFLSGRWLAPFLLAMGLVSVAHAVEPVVGETYVLTSGEYEGHLVWVGKIEESSPSPIVHLAVNGPFHSGGNAGFVIPLFGHLPIAVEAFRDSDLAVSEEKWSAEESVEEGYEVWIDARGGVFTLSISDAVTYGLEVVGQQSQ